MVCYAVNALLCDKEKKKENNNNAFNRHHHHLSSHHIIIIIVNPVNMSRHRYMHNLDDDGAPLL